MLGQYKKKKEIDGKLTIMIGLKQIVLLNKCEHGLKTVSTFCSISAKICWFNITYT